MKKTTNQFKRSLVHIVLGALIVFSITVCSNDPDNSKESPYLSKTLIAINEQVWEHNLETGKASEMYIKSTVNNGINILALNGATLGFGEIKNGILNFTVVEPGQENLSAFVDRLDVIFREWKDVAIDDPNIMGTIITPTFSDGKHRLLREKMITTNTSFGLEEILHIYVNRDCRITGTKNEGMIPGENYYFTPNDLDLALKEGWNLLCRTEIYASDQDGRDAVSMEIKELVDFKWAIW